MKRFSKDDRDTAMTHPVSFHGVPMPRGVAFAINHCEEHGAKASIASAIRVDRILNEHNRQFKTTLHGQQYLIDMHAKDPAHFAGANPVNMTSHCWFSDGNPIYKDSKGRPIPARGKLPWYMIGIDLDDIGRWEDNTHFLLVAHRLGYEFVAPYQSGSERHHLVMTRSPVPTLEHWNVISKKRSDQRVPA